MHSAFACQEVLKLHRRWAQRTALMWCVIAVVLFLGASLLMEDASIEPAAKTSGFILLGLLLTIAVVWQAAWHIVAQIHLLMEGIAPPAPPSNSHAPPDVITGA
jgi:hypothetical protein